MKNDDHRTSGLLFPYLGENMCAWKPVRKARKGRCLRETDKKIKAVWSEPFGSCALLSQRTFVSFFVLVSTAPLKKNKHSKRASVVCFLKWIMTARQRNETLRWWKWKRKDTIVCSEKKKTHDMIRRQGTQARSHLSSFCSCGPLILFYRREYYYWRENTVVPSRSRFLCQLLRYVSSRNSRFTDEHAKLVCNSPGFWVKW